MGGGGGSWGWKSPADIAKEVREAEKNTENLEFQTGLSGLLTELLSRFNDRDVALIEHRLTEIIDALEQVLDDNITLTFGGSVAKHTYVDGLSDVDCLLMLNGTGLENNGPNAALSLLEKTLREQLNGKAEVSTGQLAVTVRYGDDTEIQLLPAIKSDKGLKIPSSSDPAKWSGIDPTKFQAGLTKYNQYCNNKLVPTIKLAKAIISQLPDAQQLSGYHIESLAIDAFKGYQGTKTSAAMLPHFFEHAKNRVLKSMTDSTGQSVHVDDYMGANQSQKRQNASHLLGRIEKRMRNATASGSMPQWKSMFGDEQ
jgi:SMODS domain-containing protein